MVARPRGVAGGGQGGGENALAKSFLKTKMRFLNFVFFFRPHETYEIILWNSAVPKAERRASEMVWGPRSKGLSQIFVGC